MSRKNNFKCLDCNINTSHIEEYYMLYDHIWDKIIYGNKEGMLCIGCVERRLGRKLVRTDFSLFALINDLDFGVKSDRLKNRLTS